MTHTGPHSNKTALIVGAGLAGSLLAIYLARLGFKVKLIERRSDPRKAGYIGGRSINLALSARGLFGMAGIHTDNSSLDQLVLRNDAIPMRSRFIHPLSGPTSLQPYSSNPNDAINSVSRSGLNLSLLHHAANEPNVQLLFDQRCIDIDLQRNIAYFQNESSFLSNPFPSLSDLTAVEADLIIGADGAFSAVRARLQKTDRFDYSQSYLHHGYKELHIPPAATSTKPQFSTELDRSLFRTEPNALHIWPRGSSMMIALPNRDGSFTCTLFWPFDGPHSFANLQTPQQIAAFFNENYPDAVPMMPTLVEDYQKNPVSSLVTIRCWPWHHIATRPNSATLVIGDAAHAIVPFFGQGMNAAFEDVRELAELLAHEQHDLVSVVSELSNRRKPHADAIADMALENFIEMRDKTARPEFLYKKRVEQAVHEMFKDRATPLYNLVSFSTVPYAKALEMGRNFDAVLQRIISRVPLTQAPAPKAPPADILSWREQIRKAADAEFINS